MVGIKRLARVGIMVWMLVAASAFPTLAQTSDEQDLRVHITQVDASGFPLVTLYVSVTDAAGEPVGVEPERLQLQEDGQVIQPDQMHGSTETVEAFTTLLVFDVSGSMNSANKLEGAQAAARAFVGHMRSGDQVGLLTFNTAVTYVQPITSNQTLLLLAIDNLIAEDDTAMYDALVEAVALLEDATGRKAVIALTDGMDNVSSHTLEEVITQIGPAGLSISTVGLGDPEVQNATIAGIDAPALTSLAIRAGGQFAYANDPVSLTGLYEQYARVLQSEYAITYTSPGGLRDGLTRNLTVTLVDVEMAREQAEYNPGGLVPEVGEPASWTVFLSVLTGLVLLLFLPTVISRGLIMLDADIGTKDPKPRIRFKDT
jgi:VWFA-related protein